MKRVGFEDGPNWKRLAHGQAIAPSAQSPGQCNQPPSAGSKSGLGAGIHAALDRLKALSAATAPPPETIVTHSFTREQVSALIGKGGASIRKVREASGARVTINNDVVQGCQQVSVHGTDEQVQLALGLIADIIQGSAATAPQRPAAAPGDAPSVADVSYTMDRQSVGKLIGASGNTIRTIREQSGARIKIDNEVVPGSNSQVITIGGTEAQIKEGMRLVSGACTRDGRPRGSTRSSV